VDLPRRYSLLCFGVCSEELAQVLDDARCSFFDTEGRFHLVRPELISGQRAAVGSFASSALEHPGRESSSTTIDLTAGRVPGSKAELANPISLLHWLIAQRSAVDFHPTVRAYLSSCDPDDILPFLPFHPAPGKGGDGDSSLVVVRVRGIPAGGAPTGAQALRVGAVELLLPG
jgi:hypothetical protein